MNHAIHVPLYLLIIASLFLLMLLVWLYEAHREKRQYRAGGLLWKRRYEDQLTFEGRLRTQHAQALSESDHRTKQQQDQHMGLLAATALKVCQAIEKVPASPEQIDAGMAASNLHQYLVSAAGPQPDPGPHPDFASLPEGPPWMNQPRFGGGA